MGGSYDTYKAAMQDPWKGWWIAWPLTQRVRVGDVFDTAGGTLRTAGDLTERKVGFASSPGSPPGNFVYDSNGAVSVRFKSAGSVPPVFSALAELDIGALIEFRHGSSAFVVYRDLIQEGFSDTRSVATNLARLYWDGRWGTELVAVSDVVCAAAGTVLIATQREASAELRATASAGPGPLSLFDLAGDVTFERWTHLDLKWVGSALTPFYRVVRLRKTWLDHIETAYGSKQPGRGAAPQAIPPLVLDEAHDHPAAILEDASQSQQPQHAEEMGSQAPSSGPNQ